MSNRMAEAQAALSGVYVPPHAKRVYGYYNDNHRLIDAISACKTRSQLQRENVGAYRALRRRGLLDIAFPEPNPKKLPRDYWSLSKIQEAIDHHLCANLSQLRHKEPYAAQKAYRLGWHKNGALKFHKGA